MSNIRNSQIPNQQQPSFQPEYLPNTQLNSFVPVTTNQYVPQQQFLPATQGWQPSASQVIQRPAIVGAPQYVNAPISQSYIPTSFVPQQNFVPPQTVQQAFVPQQSYIAGPPPTQTTQQVIQQSNQQVIKGESRIEYIPYTRDVTEYVTQEVIEYVPREKKITDYYAVEYVVEHIPQVIQEKYIEYVPVETVKERTEYQAVTKQQYIQNAVIPEDIKLQYQQQVSYQPVQYQQPVQTVQTVQYQQPVQTVQYQQPVQTVQTVQYQPQVYQTPVQYQAPFSTSQIQQVPWQPIYPAATGAITRQSQFPGQTSQFAGQTQVQQPQTQQFRPQQQIQQQ